MKARKVLFLAVLALPICAQAQESEGSYVYLGARSGGSSGTMAFVNNTTFGFEGDIISASTLWVSYPPYPATDTDPAYVVRDDSYLCRQGKISHRGLRTYDKHHHLLSEKSENTRPLPAAGRGTLEALVFQKICSAKTLVPGAQNDVQEAVQAAFGALLASAPKTGKYAYPRPPQPVTVGYYPFGIAPVDHIPVPPSGAYRIPASGVDGWISAIYRAPDGHLVFEYYRNGRTDFYDTQSGRDLFPAQAGAMAHSPGGWLAEKLRPPGLLRLNSDMTQLAGPKGKHAAQIEEGGRFCHPPYSTPLTISVDGRPDRRIILFRKLRVPRAQSNPEGPDLRLRYDTQFLTVMAADNDGFFASAHGMLALIRFSWNGHSAFFSGQNDIIAAPYEAVEHARNAGRADETDCPNQAAVTRAEAVIARYAKLQMQGASPLAKP